VLWLKPLLRLLSRQWYYRHTTKHQRSWSHVKCWGCQATRGYGSILCYWSSSHDVGYQNESMVFFSKNKNESTVEYIINVIRCKHVPDQCCDPMLPLLAEVFLWQIKDRDSAFGPATLSSMMICTTSRSNNHLGNKRAIIYRSKLVGFHFILVGAHIAHANHERSDCMPG